MSPQQIYNGPLRSKLKKIFFFLKLPCHKRQDIVDDWAWLMSPTKMKLNSIKYYDINYGINYYINYYINYDKYHVKLAATIIIKTGHFNN